MTATPGGAQTGGVPDEPVAARRRAWIQRLCLLIIGLSALEFAVATTGVQIRDAPFSTDFATYYLAGAMSRDRVSPYDAESLASRGRALGLRYDQFPFLYPPPFALLMQPMTRLSYQRARQVWMVLATAALFAALGVTVLVLRRQAQALQFRTSIYLWILCAAFVPAALNSTNVHNDIRAGSVGIFLYLSLVTLVWAVLAKRSAWITFSLVTATLLKLTPVVAIAYVWWRGARGAALAALAVLLLLNVGAAWHFGASIGAEYIRDALLPSLQQEHPRPMNQSLDAMMSRLAVPSTLVRSPFDAPTFKRLATLALSLAIVIVTLRALRRRRQPHWIPIELGLLMLATFMVMKITWLHTLTATLFIWPTLMLPLIQRAQTDTKARRSALLASLGFFLASAHLLVHWQALRQGPAVLLISLPLYGLLLLWLTCHKTLQTHDATS